jgi:hypothetical protein
MTDGNNQAEEILLFPTMIYKEHLPQLLVPLKAIAKRYLDKINAERELDETYPVQQTWSFHNEPEALEFNQIILRTAWDILRKYGYDLRGLGTAFQGAWFQDHHKLSSMEKHCHPSPAQLVGFYFLDVPEEKTPWLVLDDPRPGKTQSEPLLRQSDNLQIASPRVSFKPRQGDLYLTPAWVPHSLTRNGSDKPFLLAHINVMLVPVAQTAAAKPQAPEIL